MPLDVSEYRRQTRKVFVCTSGRDFVIRKLSPSVVVRLLKIFGVNPGQELSTEEASAKFMESFEELSKLVIPAGVVEPKIGTEEGLPDALGIAEVSYDDQVDLFTAILEWSGLSTGAAEARKNLPSPPSGTQ